MGFALLISLALMGFLSIPIITASFAKRMGRPHRKWFLIGALLPVVSVLILFFLPDLSDEHKS